MNEKEFLENQKEMIVSAVQELNAQNEHLRDAFAMAALQGLLANPSIDEWATDYAKEAYKYADEMFAERERKQERTGQTKKEPLTDADIIKLWESVQCESYDPTEYMGAVKKFAQLIEKHHGV